MIHPLTSFWRSMDMPHRTNRRRGRKPWTAIGCGALLGAFLAVLFALPCEDVLPLAVAQAPEPVSPAGAQQPAEPPLDGPARMLNEAAQIHARIKDYTCTLVSQERIKGQLKPE